MSKKKPFQITDVRGWCLDNSLDIVLANVVEVAEADERVSESQIDRWRTLASINDLHFQWPQEDDVSPSTMIDLLNEAEQRIRVRGNITKSDLQGWSVLEGFDVSGGHLRYDLLKAEVITNVANTFARIIAGTYEGDATTELWLGFPERPAS